MELKDVKNIDFYDGKKRVLILGNGLSRANYKTIPDLWEDEIWACNWAYQEYINGDLPRLDLLIGDYICLKKVVPYLNKELKGVRIIGKSERSIELDGVYPPNAGKKFFSDSGSTAVVHAINEGYDEIYLLGFDLGGVDIYQHNHHLKNKKMWLRNWRYIEDKYGLDNIFFIGFDHKQIISSKYPDDVYAMKYMRGENHLDGYYEDFIKNKDEITSNLIKSKPKKSVLILGNGVTRLREPIKKFIRNWKGEIWGCNVIIYEYNRLYSINRVGIDYKELLDKALEIKSEDPEMKFDIYSSIEDDRVNSYYSKNDYFTGQKLILQALIEGYNNINIAGIDFSDRDVYNNKVRDWNEILRQTKQIMREYNHNIKFVGGTPKFLT